jgi:hypothetical protein
MPILSSEEPAISDEAIEIVTRLITYFDYLDDTARRINGFPYTRGSVLVFLPGLNDINYLDTYLRDQLSNKQFVDFCFI